jgi:hypothetical protein
MTTDTNSTIQSEPISAELLDATVYGTNLRADTLRGNLSSGATLLVFLRHFGCLFCHEMVADLREQSGKRGDQESILFFYQGTVTEGREFFGKHWPAAQAIADASLKFYKGFGIPKASVTEMLSPSVWRRGMKSLAKGHTPGMPKGSVRQMPGMLLVRGDQVVWRHDFEHAGDHPEMEAIPLWARE